VAGTYAYIFSKITGLKQYLYQYEPHSEYAIDNGMWSKGSLQYKISHYLERRAALNAPSYRLWNNLHAEKGGR